MAAAFIKGAQAGLFTSAAVGPFNVALFPILLVIMLLAWLAVTAWDRAMAERDVATVVPSEVDPFAGGYPVPPLPGQRIREPETHGERQLIGERDREVRS